MLEVVKQLHSAVCEASPGIKKDSRSADNEGVGDETAGTAVQVSVEMSSNGLESDKVCDTNTSETLVEPSEQVDHNATDTSSNGVTNKMDQDYYGGSSHKERLEEAIVWLERVVTSLAQFEDQ